MGTRLVRGEQRIELGELPEIFVNVPADEYEKLIPLASSAFLMEEKRRKIFMQPSVYTNADEATWNEYFYGTETQGFVKDAHMDFTAVIPVAERMKDGEWEKSSLTTVKKYLLGFL